MFKEEKLNQNSELKKENWETKTQFKEYKSQAAKGNIAIDKLNELVNERVLGLNYETKIRFYF